MRCFAEAKQLRSKKNIYKFSLENDRQIQISSDFDSGNISLIKQVTQFQYRLQCVPDTINGSNKKNWFYFKVKAPKNFKLRFYIEGVSIYQAMYQEYNWGKPVYRIGEQGKWLTLNQSFLIYREQVNLMIDLNFQTEQPVYIAMSIPFAYWEMQNYLQEIKYIVPQTLYYHDQVILQTKTKKNLHMLTIQDKELRKYKQLSKSGRSIILVTSRVHPGQVSGSYCFMGMLDFILSPFSLQSQILRKMFTFVIFPIVNPEGVYQGNYRMDLNGQNLNRAYLDPNPIKNETVFAIKQRIVNLLKKGDKIMFHFDLHSHSSLKKSFLYGNAFDDIILQTQTQIFCKLLDKNCQYFHQSHSQFGERHMKYKDKGQNLSKQGCARVVLSKMGLITYSYTIQSSIFPIQRKYPIQNKNQSKIQPVNTQFQIQPFSYESFQSQQNRYSSQDNVVDQNKNLGVKIMISILDLFSKNPYTSLQEKDIDELRKQVACKILQNQQRFKMLDTRAYHKSKFVSQFAKDQFYSKFKDEWNWLVSYKKFQKINWPQKFVWFKYKSQNYSKKSISMKTQSRQSKSISKEDNQFLKVNYLPQSIINRLKIQERIQQVKSEIQRLPFIRKSLQSKRIKTQQKQEISEKKLQQTEKLKKTFRNVLVTNRSNILLTFLEDEEERNQQKRISKRRMISLKMAALNKNSGQKIFLCQKINSMNQNTTQFVQSNAPCLKASHSQGQIGQSQGQFLAKTMSNQKEKMNEQQGLEFEDKQILKHIQIKKSRKQLLNRKISMLRKVNQTKRISNKNTLMKFPEIGKGFLITNLKKKLSKYDKQIQEAEEDKLEQSSTIQSNQKIQIKKEQDPTVSNQNISSNKTNLKRLKQKRIKTQAYID